MGKHRFQGVVIMRRHSQAPSVAALPPLDEVSEHLSEWLCKYRIVSAVTYTIGQKR